MKKNMVKPIAAVITAVLMLTGCAGKKEQNSVPAGTSAASEPGGSVSSTPDDTPKPAEDTDSATTPTDTSVPSSDTASEPETSDPSAPSSPDNTSSGTAKPRNCATDGHDWNITYDTSSEPKWYEEVHEICDNGYDMTLASRYFEMDADEAYRLLLENLEAVGVTGGTGRYSAAVEVWGFNAYEIKTCNVCGQTERSDTASVIPVSEWQLKSGVSSDSTLTLFYDPYNIPQDIIG